MHVDDLLDELSPEEFEERFAAYLISGVDRNREFAAIIAAETHNLINRYAEMKSGKKQKRVSFLDFIPGLFRPRTAKKSTGVESGPQAEKDLAKAFGFGS